MVFEKHLPSHPYQHLIAYFWTLRLSKSDSDAVPYRFVPDGYVDWVFHLGNPWQCNFPDNVTNPRTGRFHVFGQIKKHVDLWLPKSDLDVFGVKFYPWTAYSIWKTDMHHLTNSCVDLTDLGLNEIQTLQEKIYLSKGLEERVNHVEKYLSPFVNNSETTSLQPFFSNVSLHNTSVNLGRLGIGVRRLEQRFKREVGISPKLFLRTQRINNIIGDLRRGNHESLTQLAFKHRYYDQSHCIRDFKQFTGLNPLQFLKSINPNGDILNLRVG